MYMYLAMAAYEYYKPNLSQLTPPEQYQPYCSNPNPYPLPNPLPNQHCAQILQQVEYWDSQSDHPELIRTVLN